MDQRSPSSSSSSSKDPQSSKQQQNQQDKVIQWEDLQQELARLISLSSALQQAQAHKLSLQEKLNPLVQEEAESLSRRNELDEISQRVEDKKLVLGNMSMQSKVVEEHAKTKEDHLSGEIGSLLVSGKTLTVARKRLQESGRLLAGEIDGSRLSNVQRMLRARQQYMISQVSYLFPVKTLIGAAQELELDSFPSVTPPGRPSGLIDDDRQKNPGNLSILGVQLSMTPFTQMTFFTEKKLVQRSTTALGYVAHAVSLIASYLHVQLRYPLRLGVSHSYIMDFAPFVEPASSDSSSTALVSASNKCLVFPLFVDGQDVTRAAYAIFLLNKDIEQLLDYVGGQSLGPKHVLANLKELFRTTLSLEFVERAMI